jgi:hypothetical protein
MAENFQDNVQYGGSTLGVSGNAVSIGTAGGAKSVIFNNSDSVGHLAWQPTAARTINLPDAGGTVMLTSQGILSLSAGGARATSGEVVFSNSNGLAFGVNGQTITGSYTVPTVTAGSDTAGISNLGNTAGTSGVVSGDQIRVLFAGGNNITLSQSVDAGNKSATITISGPNTAAQTVQTVGLYALGNTTQNSSTTLDARTLSFNGLGGITMGYSNGSIQVSGPQTVAQTVQTIGLYASSQTTGQSSSSTVDARSLSIVGAGGVSVGLSGGSFVVSGGNFSAGLSNVGNTSGNTTVVASQLVLAGGNNITVSGSTNGASMTITISAPNLGAGAMSAGASNLGNTAGSTGVTGTRLVLVGTNMVSLSQSTDANGGTLSFNATQSNQAGSVYGLGNTTGTSSGTYDARTLSINVSGALSIAASNSGFNLSVPATSSLSATGIVSIAVNGSTISIGAATFNAYALGNTTQNSSSNLDLRSVSLNGLGGMSVGYAGGSIQLSVPNQSLSVWEPYPLVTGSAYSSHAPASWLFNRVVIDDPVVVSNVYVGKSVSMGVAAATSVASAGSQKFSYSHGFTVFTRQNFGAQSTNLTTVGTASFGLSGSLSYTSTSILMGYSWVTNSTGGTTSFSTTSSSSNLATYFSGAKLFPVPWVTTLLPGEYFFAHAHSSTTQTNNSNVTLMSFSNLHIAPQLQNFGVLGSSGTFSSLIQAGAGAGVASAITTNNTFPMSVVSGTAQNNIYMAFSNAGP